MQLFYNTSIRTTSKDITFDKDESRHIGKVLRKQIGDILYITDGIGNFYEIVLENSNPKRCSGKIINVIPQEPMSYSLHLAVAPTKLNDRYEWFLEKATEIGVTEITPIICNHSERKIIKPERYEKIISSAAKQSQKAFFPILNKATSFDQFIENNKNTNATKFIAHCEDSKKHSLKSKIEGHQQFIILIGPEGDFSSKEIEIALTNNFEPITLGASRLRTETAAIVACHSIYFYK
ncbi:16S rRNA (uracil(1498)-N(3))-methyltransferase [Patiriisocius sp. Uisw_017]|jgi:16S rRNA (uracil1498-N3)-methyltransferase|uniref:16S rRNA (uracil(1498)-N(3))-methyltransferase n=1 Tax=Patiriisocius sp. Uisw_017 TaxID=3230968 RepID=UPI0039E987CC